MFQVVCCFVILVAIAGSGESAHKKLPPFIIPCKRNDPELNKCFTDRGNDIIPLLKNDNTKYKISSINPLKINEAILNPGRNLKLVLRNVDAYGLEGLKILKTDVNLKDGVGVLKIDAIVPFLQLISTYEIEGQISILPITGNGKSNITLDELNLSYVLHVTEREKNGEQLLNVGENTFKSHLKRITFDLDNLFNGDARLSTEMLKFMNENWELIYEELGGSFEEILASVLKSFIVQIIQDVPMNEIFLPD